MGLLPFKINDVKALVVVIFILAIGSSYCQISQRDRTTIINLLRPPCSESNGEHNYFTYFNCTNCIPDSSDIYPGLTEGAVYRNEYVLHHHPISVKNDQELLKYIRNKAVTNEEYLAFEDWVRDSLANMVDEPNFDAKFMQRDKKKTYYRNGLEIPAGYVYREDIRPDISFDHSKIFAFDDPMYMPYIAHMYLPYPQRFYNSREFDKRKYYYHYTSRIEKIADLPYD